MASHAADAEAGCAVAGRPVPSVLPPGTAVGSAVETVREVAAGPVAAGA